MLPSFSVKSLIYNPRNETCSAATKLLLPPKKLQIRDSWHSTAPQIPHVHSFSPAPSNQVTPSKPRSFSSGVHHLTGHRQQPHTPFQTPSTPPPKAKALPPRSSPSPSPLYSPRQTTCSPKTRTTHSRCPRKTRPADRFRSAASLRSPAGSRERACNRAEGRRAGIPWVVWDMCRL